MSTESSETAAKTAQPSYDGEEVDSVLGGELAVLFPGGKEASGKVPAKQAPAAAKQQQPKQQQAPMTARQRAMQRLEELDGKYDEDEADSDSDATASDAPAAESEEGADPDASPDENTDEDADDTATEEESDDEDESDDEEETVRNPRGLLARLTKLKAQRNAVREALAGKEKEITELKSKFDEVATASIRHEPTAEEPLGHVATEAELDQTEAYWKGELKWCRDHKSGGTRQTADGKTKELDEDEVAARMDKALEIIQHAPARRRLLAAQKADVQKAAAAFPFFTPNHALHAEFVAYADSMLYAGEGEGRRLREQVAGLPDYASRIADAFLGKIARDGKFSIVPMPDGKVKLVPMQKADPKAGKPQPKPPVSVRAGNPPARRSGAKPSLQEANASGDIDAVLDAELRL